jgi:peroxiredoxin
MDRRTRPWGWTILVMAASLAWLLPGSGTAGMPERFAALGITPIEPPRPAIDFALKDVEGKLVRLSDLHGKVVLLNFEATWCPSCRAQAPKLEQLHQRLKGQDFVLLSVHLQERPSTVKAFRQEHGMNFPAVIDADGTVSERYGVQFIPTTYLIDRAGRMVGRTVGPKAWDSEEAKDLIVSLINQPQG